jgi:hypothetical protein
MADSVRRVEYFKMAVPDKPGEGARALGTLKEAGVNLLAFSGFPRGRWKVTGPKRAFLVSGEDRVGAVAELLGKLAAARINVIATDAVCAGERYGVILWVAPRDVNRAAKALGA